MEEDLAELEARYHNLQFELQSPEDCFYAVKGLIQGSPALPYFASILQHLLLIRDDAVARCVRSCVVLCCV